MIYYSTHSDDYLYYLILRGKQKQTKTHPNTMFLPIFNVRNKNKQIFFLFFRTVELHFLIFFIPHSYQKHNCLNVFKNLKLVVNSCKLLNRPKQTKNHQKTHFKMPLCLSILKIQMKRQAIKNLVTVLGRAV